MMQNKKICIVLLSAILLAIFSVVDTIAQEVMTYDQEKVDLEALFGKNSPNWGTTISSYSISAFDCDPYTNTMVYTLDIASGRRNRTCGSNLVCHWYCPVHVPNGSKVVAFSLVGCDYDSVGYIFLELAKTGPTGSYSSVTSFQTFTNAGCLHWVYYLPNNKQYEVDNENDSWLLYVSLVQDANTVSFSALHVWYALQVSPAPATATFIDVPTSHIFFQYVEALVAAGITGGCDATHYCPNNYVTRGQMAKFLAVALG